MENKKVELLADVLRGLEKNRAENQNEMRNSFFDIIKDEISEYLINNYYKHPSKELQISIASFFDEKRPIPEIASSNLYVAVRKSFTKLLENRLALIFSSQEEMEWHGEKLKKYFSSQKLIAGYDRFSTRLIIRWN